MNVCNTRRFRNSWIDNDQCFIGIFGIGFQFQWRPGYGVALHAVPSHSQHHITIVVIPQKFIRLPPCHPPVDPEFTGPLLGSSAVVVLGAKSAHERRPHGSRQMTALAATAHVA